MIAVNPTKIRHAVDAHNSHLIPVKQAYRIVGRDDTLIEGP